MLRSSFCDLGIDIPTKLTICAHLEKKYRRGVMRIVYACLLCVALFWLSILIWVFQYKEDVGIFLVIFLGSLALLIFTPPLIAALLKRTTLQASDDDWKVTCGRFAMPIAALRDVSGQVRVQIEVNYDSAGHICAIKVVPAMTRGGSIVLRGWGKLDSMLEAIATKMSVAPTNAPKRIFLGFPIASEFLPTGLLATGIAFNGLLMFYFLESIDFAFNIAAFLLVVSFISFYGLTMLALWLLWRMFGLIVFRQLLGWVVLTLALQALPALLIL